jgi:hypothetical protein
MAGDGATAVERAAWPAALARLAGGLVHDARNPLHVAALQIALLDEEVEAPVAAVAAAHLAALRAQVARLDGLLHDFSALADAPDERPADLAELARIALRLHGPALRARRLGAEVRVVAGTRAAVGRPSHVAGLVLLALGAAMEEAEEAGLLQVEVGGRDGRAELRLAYPARSGLEGGGAGLATAAALARDLGGGLERRDAGGRIELVASLPGGGPT